MRLEESAKNVKARRREAFGLWTYVPPHSVPGNDQPFGSVYPSGGKRGADGKPLFAVGLPKTMLCAASGVANEAAHRASANRLGRTMVAV
jgi:hypothetical protein